MDFDCLPVLVGSMLGTDRGKEFIEVVSEGGFEELGCELEDNVSMRMLWKVERKYNICCVVLLQFGC